MKKPILMALACIVAAIPVYAQSIFSIEPMAGFSPRNAGRVVVGAQLAADMLGAEHAHFGLLGGAVAEIGEGASTHLGAYAASYEWRFYAGISYFHATSPKLAEGSRWYPMGGISWLPGKAGMDLRYQGDGIYLSFLFSFKKP